MSDRLIFKLSNAPGYVDGSKYTPGKIGNVPPDTVALSFEGMPIGDEVVSALPDLGRIICMDFDGTSISDRCISDLLRFPTLRELWMEQTQLTDYGLFQLANLKALEFVSIVDTAVTPGGIAEFKRERPKVIISG